MSSNVLNPRQTNISYAALFVLVAMLFFATIAEAGTGGSEFDSIWETVKDWSQGTLGRVISVVMVLVGIVGGIARQSIMAFAIGVGGGVGLYNTPNIIESIVTATISNQAISVVIPMSNGLL